MGSRADSTSRVTCAVAAWLWQRGSRVIVTEVGLSSHGNFLERPWGSIYRVDMVAIVGDQTHVIEVKGTRADAAREDMKAGKWILPYDNFVTWLACDQSVAVDLPTRWGQLSVDGHRVRVVRAPTEVVDKHREKSLETLSSVLCLQSLPTMMGLTRAGQMATLENHGFDRPWRNWEPRCEEPGNVL